MYCYFSWTFTRLILSKLRIYGFVHWTEVITNLHGAWWDKKWSQGVSESDSLNVLVCNLYIHISLQQEAPFLSFENSVLSRPQVGWGKVVIAERITKISQSQGNISGECNLTFSMEVLCPKLKPLVLHVWLIFGHEVEPTPGHNSWAYPWS